MNTKNITDPALRKLRGKTLVIAWLALWLAGCLALWLVARAAIWIARVVGAWLP